MTTTATLKQRIDTQALELTPALKSLAVRYFSDSAFRLNLHSDAHATLAKAEIMLSDLEMATVMSYLSSSLIIMGSQRLAVNPGDLTSVYSLPPFMTINAWGEDH